MISTETSARRFALRAADSGACRALRKILRPANKSRESARSHDGRRTQIDLRIGITIQFLKFRFVALIAISPFPTRPRPRPMQVPQPGGRNRTRVYQSLPVTDGLSLRLHFCTRRGEIKSTPSATRCPRPRTTSAASRKSSTRALTHDKR